MKSFFGSSSDSAIIEEVEKATNENNKEEDWDVIITICDKAKKGSEEAKSYFRAIVKRLYNSDPHIAIQAVTLLDACIKNSGKVFHIEVASREFENDFMKLMEKAHKSVAQRLRECLKRWAENEFKSDSHLTLIPSLYSKLRSSGLDFNSNDMSVKKSVSMSKDPNVVESQEEENEILKAIELSLKETSAAPRASASANSNLYPTANISLTNTSTATATNSTPAKEPMKVRALYDFEAAEDNELTFKSGEIIFVIDDSDQNWWRGNNQRGEGLFPANFVTKDLDVEPEKFLYEKAKKIVQFKEAVETQVVEQPADAEIDEEKINRLLHLLHEADPTNPDTDTEEMLKLEREVDSMGPKIDSELERVDRKHAQLTQLSADLVEALGLYHTLMREPQYTPKMVPPPNFANFPGAPQQIYNGLPPAPPPQGQMMGPSPHGIMPYGLPPPGMMGPPPPGYMMQGEDRRMAPPNYGTMPPPHHFPPLSTPSQTMIHNGPPSQGQHYMPTSSNPK